MKLMSGPLGDEIVVCFLNNIWCPILNVCALQTGGTTGGVPSFSLNYVRKFS